LCQKILDLACERWKVDTGKPDKIEKAEKSEKNGKSGAKTEAKEDSSRDERGSSPTPSRES
jgi:hypothetical protein